MYRPDCQCSFTTKTACLAQCVCFVIRLAAVTCIDPDYSLARSTSCSACPAGYSCTTTSITPCEPGFFSLVAQTDCTECPTGYACPSITTAADKFKCQPGESHTPSPSHPLGVVVYVTPRWRTGLFCR